MSRGTTAATGEGAARKQGSGTCRAAFGLAIAGVFLLVFLTGAVGIIGSEDHPGNVMYLGVVGLAIVGAGISRLRPGGMSIAMFAAAAAVALVGAIAIIGGMGMPGSPPLELLGLTGIFAAIFAGSGLLFREAARARGRG